MGVHRTGELLGPGNVLTQTLVDASNAELAQHEPQLQGPEAASELDAAGVSRHGD